MQTLPRWSDPKTAPIPRRLRRPCGIARLAGLLLALGLLAAPGSARGGGRFVLARAESFTPHLTAYARVEPTASLPVRVRLAGTVEALSCLPGDRLPAGTVIARLTGPAVTALLTERREAVRSAAAALAAGRRSLDIERRMQKAHLSTRLAVEQARAALAKNEADAAVAAARLQAALAMRTLRSPVAGRVLALHVANGETVETGDPILSLAPAHSLWLRAAFYGADAAAVHAGMGGSFTPFQGGPPEAVRVRTIFATLDPDGGESVGLLPDQASPGWKNGASGTVTLAGSKRTLVAIPTRALILDRGRWWVLVHTAKGDRRQAVTPGPSRGDTTLIEKGLAAGTPVVVENAYLEFHRRISGQYSPPD